MLRAWVKVGVAPPGFEVAGARAMQPACAMRSPHMSERAVRQRASEVRDCVQAEIKRRAGSDRSLREKVGRYEKGEEM